jgi:hypothetical protein
VACQWHTGAVSLIQIIVRQRKSAHINLRFRLVFSRQDSFLLALSEIAAICRSASWIGTSSRRI